MSLVGMSRFEKRDLFITVAGALYSPSGAEKSLRNCKESCRTGCIRNSEGCVLLFKMFPFCKLWLLKNNLNWQFRIAFLSASVLRLLTSADGITFPQST